ncbi:Glycerol-3-phosphate transporter [Posidoniimonas polymericola]|uniref:Glycerol-3-phosphate transporter n=1 Tax=Posidoniimonas polymericola TaxID=2528002 RepID=A0A5C5YTD4_9BACT|nr:MFS transporter [Posidoniimonas polymericola]TWT78225.1 Glycerol-3-phosphate transporter [Posidoniimonas polymericola]
MASPLQKLRAYYAPPPAQPRVSPEEAARLYPSYRWRALEATFIGYATFYLVRNNLGIVAKDVEDALLYSKSMIGDILAITAISYGISKFVMGSISDRSDPRKFMATGLLLSAVLNFAFGGFENYYVHLALWSMNGFAQGMGWPPCGRVMGHWYSESERGFTFSIWNTSHNLGGAIAGILTAEAVTRYGGWQYAFYVPGALAAIGAAYLFIRLRDTPQSVGLPPIEEFRDDYPANQERGDIERELSTRELLLDRVLANKYVWLLAIANFFAYITRYSMLDWGPTYLREIKGADISQAAWAISSLELAGIPSTIFLGWVSDKLGGRRGMVAALSMLPIIFAFAAIPFVPPGYLWVDVCLLGVVGFFIYPVINLITIAALDVVSKKAIGAAAGFIGLFGYIGRTIQAKGFGWGVDVYTASHDKLTAWNGVLAVIVASGVIAAVLLAFTWNLRTRE